MKLRRSNIVKISDSQLVWLYCDTRRKEYYGELFRRYLPLIYGVALKYFPDRDAAKQCVKQLFEKLPEGLVADAEMIGEFKDWLYERSCMFAGSGSKEVKSEDGLQREILSYAATELLDSLKNADNKSVVESLRELSSKMTKPQKECIGLFFVEKRSFADIAQQTGYLIDNVRSHIVKGLDVMVVAREKSKQKKGAV